MRFMHRHKTTLLAGKKVKERVLGARYVVRKNYWWLLNPFHAAALSRIRRLKAKGARGGGKTILNSEFRSLATLTFLSFEFKILSIIGLFRYPIEYRIQNCRMLSAYCSLL